MSHAYGSEVQSRLQRSAFVAGGVLLSSVVEM